MKSNLVPFGKYRGRPVEEMAVDREYCDWLMAQPWFSERYRDVYHVVVNYGGEPQDSPEHNRLQARLLDDDFCISVIWAACSEAIDPVSQIAGETESVQKMMSDAMKSKEARCTPLTVRRREFECFGWDCLVELAGGVFFSTARTFYGFGPEGHKFGIECKPSVGEEYPTILRQVKGFPNGGGSIRRIVLTEAMTMQSVPAHSVVKMFKASGINLVTIDDIENERAWRDAMTLRPADMDHGDGDQ